MKQKIITIICGLIILLDGQFFCCLPQVNLFLLKQGLNSYYNRTLIGMLCIALTAIVLLFNNDKAGIIKTSLKEWGVLTIIWFVCLGLVVIYSIIEYDQGIRYIFNEVRHYVLLLYAYPIMYLLLCYRSVDKLMKLITICALANVLVICATVISYDISGRYIFEIETSGIREGAQYSRSALGSLFPLVIIYSFSLFLEKRKMTFAILTILYLLNFYFVDQTRARMIYYAISFGIMLMTTGMTSKRSLNIVFLMATIVYIFYSGVFSKFIDSFFDTSGNYYSTETRFEELSYFKSVFFNNPLTGYGLISEYYPELEQIKKGSSFSYHVGDVGLVGLLAEGGLLLTIPFLLYLFFLYHSYQKIQKESPHRVFLSGIVTYCIVSSATQSLNRQILFLLVPVSVAIVQYELYQQQISKKDTSDTRDISDTSDASNTAAIGSVSP